MGAKSVFHFTSEKARTYAEQRKQSSRSPSDLQTLIRGTLRLPARDASTTARVRILRSSGGDRGYPKPFWINYAVESEAQIQAVCTCLGEETLYSRLPLATGPSAKALVWVAERSSDAELREQPELRKWIEQLSPSDVFLAVDVRGVGESLPGTTSQRDPHSYYGADYFYAAYANMLNRPYLGGKTFDVLCVLDWLKSCGYQEIQLASQGWGTLPTTLAATQHPAVTKVTLLKGLDSWHEIALSEHYRWPLSHMLFGVLEHWDLPDARELITNQGKQLVLA